MTSSVNAGLLSVPQPSVMSAGAGTCRTCSGVITDAGQRRAEVRARCWCWGSNRLGVGGSNRVRRGETVDRAGPVKVQQADWTPPTWEQVVRDHSARVYRLAYRLTGNSHDAEDLTQEVFVRVFRSLSKYTPGTFEGWLHRITTNLFLDQARRKQRIRFEGLAEDAADRLQGREPTPAQVYDDTNFDADVQSALDALAPEYRAAVVLCDIE